MYSHTQRRLKVHDVVVLNRLEGSGRLDLVGIPFLIQCENFRSCTHLYRHVVEQALRFATPDEVEAFLKAMRDAQAKAGSSSFEWPVDALPFSVRITSIANLLAVRPGIIYFSSGFDSIPILTDLFTY